MDWIWWTRILTITFATCQWIEYISWYKSRTKHVPLICLDFQYYDYPPFPNHDVWLPLSFQWCLIKPRPETEYALYLTFFLPQLGHRKKFTKLQKLFSFFSKCQKWYSFSSYSHSGEDFAEMSCISNQK